MIDTKLMRYFPRGISTNFSLTNYQKMMPVTNMLHEAADEIDNLRDQLYCLREALAEAKQ
jgi:ubiquinone biosynthesis protein UbiJ